MPNAPRFLLLLALATASLRAQVPTATLDALTPPGGPIGETVAVSVHGTFLDDIQAVFTSHPKVSGKVAEGKIHLAIPKDLAPQVIDVRVQGRYGVSNPRAFVLGPHPESLETSTHTTREQAQPCPINHTVSGTVAPATIDWYQCQLSGMEPIHLDVMAERIDSRMDPTLIIYDHRGRELARYRDGRGRDITTTFTPTEADATITLAVHDFLFEGGASYFYRLTVSEMALPITTPMRTPAELPCANLAPDPDSYPSDEAVRLLPASYQGKLPRGETGSMDFQPEASGPVVVEIFSERLGDPSDFRLRIDRVTEEDTLQKIGENDDIADPIRNKRHRFGSRDPLLRFEATKAKRYRLTWRNQFRTGGAFRLEIRQPQPHIHLIAATDKPAEVGNQLSPWNPVLRRGDTVSWEILALRRDGMGAPITVTVPSLPKGVTASPLVIDRGHHHGTLTLTAHGEAEAFAGPLVIQGTSQQGEKTFQCQAQGAGLLWKVNDANQERWASRLSPQPFLTVLAESPAPIALTPSQTHYDTCLGAQLAFTFGIERAYGQAGNFKTRLHGLPGMRRPPEATFDPNAKEVTLTLNLVNRDNNTFAPGTYAIHACGTEGKVRYRPDLAKEETKEYEHAFISPPITLAIADGPLTFSTITPFEIPAGDSRAVPIAVKRQFGFADAVQLALVPPKEPEPTFTKAEASLAKDQTEATLQVAAPQAATPGTYEATLEAKLNFNGQALTMTRPVTFTILAPTPSS